MRLLLTIIIFFSAVIDTCLAEDIASETSAEISQSVVRSASPCSELPPHNSHSSDSQGTNSGCHQCHLGHCGILLDEQLHLLDFRAQTAKISYQFVVPSAFLRTLKRPPKSAA